MYWIRGVQHRHPDRLSQMDPQAQDLMHNLVADTVFLSTYGAGRLMEDIVGQAYKSGLDGSWPSLTCPYCTATESQYSET
jgi:hypothetical protein